MRAEHEPNNSSYRSFISLVAETFYSWTVGHQEICQVAIAGVTEFPLLHATSTKNCSPSLQWRRGFTRIRSYIFTYMHAQPRNATFDERHSRFHTRYVFAGHARRYVTGDIYRLAWIFATDAAEGKSVDGAWFPRFPWDSLRPRAADTFTAAVTRK